MKPSLLLVVLVLATPLPDAPVTREVYLMGTRAVLATWAADRPAALATLDRLLGELESTEAQLSTWRPDSELTRLNVEAASGPFHLSPSLCALLGDVQHWVGITGGAFDPAIGALLSAWDVHGRGRLPSTKALEDARDRSGWRHVQLDRASCTVATAQGVTIDVGAFGKGEALDRARAAVDPRAAWMIDLGGQVAVSGAPPGEEGWTIGIAHPQRRDEPVRRVLLRGGSLATSAGSERDRQAEGRRVGHIVDPGTGRSAPFDGSVSVWHEQALAADALSTALFVMGPDDGLLWAAEQKIAVLYLIPDSSGGVTGRASPAFAARFQHAPEARLR